MKILWTILFGFVAGIVGGMGMGGGTFLIPLLSFLDYGQKSIQGANLISFLPMAVVALVLHFKNKLVKTEGVLWVILPAVILSVAGALFTNNVSPKFLKVCFGMFFIGIGLFQLYKSILAIKKDKKQTKNKK